MLKIYKDKDAGLKTVSKDKILIIGYGSQARAFAQNLGDSGLNVTACLRPKSASLRFARADKIPVITPSQIDSGYSMFLFMIPDHIHAEFYEKYIRKNLKQGSCLLFAHAYSIHFGLVKPPENVDIVLVAPHGPGQDLREKFLQKQGLSCFVSVWQDFTGTGLQRALAIAKGIGSTRAGAFRTTFEQEALGDLFGEQVLLCGGLSELVIKSFEVLVNNGITPENAYLETAHQIDLLASLIKQYGIAGMMDRISMTAQYGMLKTSGKIIDKSAENRIEKVFQEIKSGKFARDWQKEYKSGLKNLNGFKRSMKKNVMEKSRVKIKKVFKE